MKTLLLVYAISEVSKEVLRMVGVRRGGYWNKIGLVNLSSKSAKYLEFNEPLYEKYIGGVGLGAKLLIDNTSPRIKPLSSENLLIFSIGPVEDLSLQVIE